MMNVERLSRSTPARWAGRMNLLSINEKTSAKITIPEKPARTRPRGLSISSIGKKAAIVVNTPNTVATATLRTPSSVPVMGSLFVRRLSKTLSPTTTASSTSIPSTIIRPNVVTSLSE